MALSGFKRYLKISSQLQLKRVLEMERMRVVYHFFDLRLLELVSSLLLLESLSLLINHFHSLNSMVITILYLSDVLFTTHHVECPPSIHYFGRHLHTDNQFLRRTLGLLSLFFYQGWLSDFLLFLDYILQHVLFFLFFLDRTWLIVAAR